MKIVCFKYYEALYPENVIFIDRENPEGIPMSFCFYLISTEDKNILIDVGCNGLERYKPYIHKTPLELLEEYGLTPQDITDVVITHAHFDHIEGIAPFVHCNIHMQRYEVERAKKFLQVWDNVHLFDESYAIAKDVNVVRIGGHTEGSSVIFAKNYLICGDEAYFMRSLKERVRNGNCDFPEKMQAFLDKYCDSEYAPLFLHDASILPNQVGFMTVFED